MLRLTALSSNTMIDPIKVALITGGSKGIGRACGERLAAAGYTVAFNYHHDDVAAEEAVTAIGAHGRPVRSYRADLGEAMTPGRLVEDVLRDFGRLDLLVNNAAVAPTTPIDTISVDEWDRVMATNLRATFFCAQAALRHMRERKSGRMVFVSSQAGQAGGVFIGAHYVASKAAMIGLAKSFAKAGAADGILVNCVCPGQVDTPLTRQFPADRVAALTQAIPLKRMGTADEVANVIAFLASDAASYITGATIPVNGGLLMP